MKITIETIRHEDQRYPTVGDWIWEPSNKQKGEGELRILVSESGDWRMNAAVAVHELVESLLCIEHDVAQSDVDRFDQQFEAAFAENPTIAEPGKPGAWLTDEPGEIPAAPYYAEHMVATVVERLFAWQIGLVWPAYELRLGELMETNRKVSQ